MNHSTATQLDSIASALKEGAGKLADLLKQQAALKTELEIVAADADATGLADFAEIFRDMAWRLGPLGNHRGKPATTPTPSKPHGRPPKPTADKLSST